MGRLKIARRGPGRPRTRARAGPGRQGLLQHRDPLPATTERDQGDHSRACGPGEEPAQAGRPPRCFRRGCLQAAQCGRAGLLPAPSAPGRGHQVRQTRFRLARNRRRGFDPDLAQAPRFMIYGTRLARYSAAARRAGLRSICWPPRDPLS